MFEAPRAPLFHGPLTKFQRASNPALGSLKTAAGKEVSKEVVRTMVRSGNSFKNGWNWMELDGIGYHKKNFDDSHHTNDQAIRYAEYDTAVERHWSRFSAR